MTKLTKEQILFIDNYLKNSGVEYLDIRHEMTDHVATALEEINGDFYDNFTEYMLKHKKGLLESNKKFARASRKRALKMLLRTIVSPLFLLAWGVLFGISYILIFIAGYEISSNILSIIYSLFLIILFGTFVYANLISRKKIWSVADKMLGLLSFFFYFLIVIFKVDRLVENQTVLLSYYSFLACFACAGYICIRQLKNKYKLRYNG